MARYRGVIKGSRFNKSTRLGSKSTGLKVTANGWEIGCEVDISYDEANDRDLIEIYITEGSKKKSRKKVIYTNYGLIGELPND